jgi:5-methylcytosine-specific restriction endonuclease McrBC GTP-binding regulatory subunit McrB
VANVSATQAKIDEVVAAIKRDGLSSIISLSGAPGTGKSFIALAAAQAIARHPLFLKQIQFHQSYSYEDFIEGLKPNTAGGFAPRSGVFMEWNEAALQDSANTYVLLIEELSRANVSNVLGELMTYIEHRGRTFETPLTRRRMMIAPNLMLVSTMNPLDRSALEIDDALIRRLSIVSCPPSAAQLREMLQKNFTGSEGEAVLDQLCNLFTELEKQHPDTFDELMPFGHGIFSGVTSADDLVYLWEHRLRHILRRPQTPPHPYFDAIQKLYPWRK